MQVDPPIFSPNNISSANSISTQARGMSNWNKLVLKKRNSAVKKAGHHRRIRFLMESASIGRETRKQETTYDHWLFWDRQSVNRRWRLSVCRSGIYAQSCHWTLFFQNSWPHFCLSSSIDSYRRHPFTAFEAYGRVRHFTRISYGFTNAVPVLQQFMDKFIESKRLTSAEPNLDDVYIGTRTKETHDLNLKRFLDAAAQEHFTPTWTNGSPGDSSWIYMVVSIIEGSSNRPESERLRVLKEYLFPYSMPQLRRFTGFFCCYFKWVHR